MEETVTGSETSNHSPVGMRSERKVKEKMPKGVLRYIGIDLSRKKCAICFLSPDGKINEMKHSLGLRERELFFRLFRPGDLILMEESALAFALARELNGKEGVVACVASAEATRPRGVKKMTGREGAARLARLILENPLEDLPLVRIPTEEEAGSRLVADVVSLYEELHRDMLNRLISLFHEDGFFEVGEEQELHTKEGRAEAIEKYFGGDEDLSVSKRLAEELDRTLTEAEETIEEERKNRGESAKKT